MASWWHYKYRLTTRADQGSAYGECLSPGDINDVADGLLAGGDGDGGAELLEGFFKGWQAEGGARFEEQCLPDAVVADDKTESRACIFDAELNMDAGVEVSLAAFFCGFDFMAEHMKEEFGEWFFEEV